MPVVHVTALRPEDPALPGRVIAGLPAVVAALTGVEQPRIWATFRALEPGEESLGGVAQTALPGSVIFVDLHLKDRGPELNDAVLSAVCQHVAAGFAAPVEDVWGRLYVVRSGELFAGGRAQRWG